MDTDKEMEREIDALVLRDRARLIRDSGPAAFLSAEFSLTMIALTAWVHSHDMRIWIFCAIFTTVQLLRWLYIVLADRAGLVERRPDLFMNYGAVGSFIAGLCWMAIPLLSWKVGGVWAGATATISVAGAAAGAVMLYSSRAIYALLNAIPALIGSVTFFIAHGTEDGYFLALNTTIFALFVSANAFRQQAFLIRSLRLVHERSQLVQSLELANDRAQAAVQQFEFLAMHDPLTGLLNRSAIADRLQARLGDSENKGRHVGLMLLDLDHFKQINDLFGHPVGDALLIEVAKRISSVTSCSDLIGRLGGDEFIIVFDGDEGGAEALGQALIRAMTVPIALDSRWTQIGLSMGVALCPQHGQTADILMSHADIALYAAKRAGRHRWVMFHDGLAARASKEQEIETELRAALRDGQISYCYQPQVAVSDHRVIGLEALLRWNHPTRGLIAPADIVEAAQRSNQVEALLGCALQDACLMLRRLDAHGMSDVRVAVNVSPRDFELCDVASLVEAALRRHVVAAWRLEIEITEDAILDVERAEPQLERLERLGVPLAVDDFGIGHASIARLQDLKIKRLKIDRRFVIDIERSESARMLFSAIAAMGRSLKIELLAEGIESLAQLQVIAALGCNVAQGYLFASAMTPDDVFAWLETRTPRQAI
ncbi:putative bifunctional diguanylate cyclase/phosphodiesterase [Rhizobium sp. YIM 134829]|uniref:putative bifunctional diguanylate cyclase/phosphodiesterase n=1 Tax=Rhizobium sp. YIM 134829 TaxID=3390453 RepID=UPI0039798F33